MWLNCWLVVLNFELLFFQVGTNVTFFIQRKNKERTQPFLLQIDRDFYIIVDAIAIFLGITNFTNALDLLFKCHYVFNLSYAKQVSHFYDFIQKFVYKVGRDGKMVAKVRELGIALNL